MSVCQLLGSSGGRFAVAAPLCRFGYSHAKKYSDVRHMRPLVDVTFRKWAASDDTVNVKMWSLSLTKGEFYCSARTKQTLSQPLLLLL